MTKIKQQAMTGTGVDMCNIPVNESYGSGYHIMAYHKDVTGEILSTVPSQPNLLITHKNSMYMSGYWDSSSSALSWRLLNLGDGSDILTTTTTTTTTTPKPTRYVINGSFAVRLFNPQMVMVDPNGDERIVDVEFENPSTGFIPSYDAYVVTTTFNPTGYKLRVSGYDALKVINRKYWAGEITLPNTAFWRYVQNTNEYYITRTFTSSILTTTTSTTTTAAPTAYEYTIQVNSTSVDLLSLKVTVSNSQTPSRIAAGSRSGTVWTFNFIMPVFASTGWKFVFTGTGSVDRKDYTATLTNQTFVEGVCTIRTLNLISGFITMVPGTGPIRPLSLDDPEDTNSLDDAINDYLNEQ